jgi:hypothetical protein
MKRIVLQLTVITLLVAGGLLGSAQAQYPRYAYRNYVGTPTVVVYGGQAGYGNGYGVGYGGYGTSYSAGYGNGYYGYSPYANQYSAYPRSAPYGAGYIGGYQPYQEMYLQRLYYGLGN